MLKSLSILNIAVISNVEINFEDGLNILTGETGAGKSIVIDAINLILGDRASKEIIRTGEDRARVEALFHIDERTSELLREIGIDCDDELLISREIFIDGKSNIRINGSISTATILKNIGNLLVNIHGQHDNKDLLNSEKHLSILDSYAGNFEIKNQYTELYNEVYNLSKELERINTDIENRERKLSILQYEIDCIENARLKEGEYEELINQRKLISNSRKIMDNLNESYNKIYSGNSGYSAYELVSESLKMIEEVSSFDENILNLHEKASQVFYELEDISADLRDYITKFDFDESRIDEIEKRIDELNDIRRRFGKEYSEIMAYYENAVSEANLLKNIDENISELTKKIENKKNELRHIGESLSKIRKKAAKELENRIIKELNELNMPNTKFVVDIKSEEKFYKDGLDKVEFLISPNVGMDLNKLSKIASGGELSRIMLSINSATLNKDDIPTMIYDEIDTGVSGRAAQKIAEKLHKVSKQRQVICVTHLAQIAAMADSHFLIEKNVSENSTKTTIKRLNNEEKVKELARILGGVSISEHTYNNAKDMLFQSESFKKNFTINEGK